MISSLAWIRRGASAAHPVRFELSPEEEAYLVARAQELDLGEDDLPDELRGPSDDDEDDLAGAEEAEDMEAEAEAGAGAMPPPPPGAEEDDDDEDDDEDGEGEVEMDFVGAEMPMGEDPLGIEGEASDDSDLEDDTLVRTDALCMVALADEDCSTLEVHVYDEISGNLYVHHDIALPAFPLSLAWLNAVPRADAAPEATGSFVAVGTFKPGIEIWNLDVLDALEPAAVLGGLLEPDEADMASAAAATGSRKKKGKKKKKKNKPLMPTLAPGSHADAVVALSWNQHHRNILASGSADTTVKLWDVTTQQCGVTLDYHASRVQVVEWHPVEAEVLLTAGGANEAGAGDRVCAVLDPRAPETAQRFDLPADAEAAQWNPHNAATFAVATNAGTVLGYDIRSPGAPLFGFDAHQGEVSSLAFCPLVAGLVATCSVDKFVRLWDVHAAQPVMVCEKNMGAGELFSVGFYADSPFLLAAGGSKGLLAVWDATLERGVQEAFVAPGDRVLPHTPAIELASPDVQRRVRKAQQETARREAAAASAAAANAGTGTDFALGEGPAGAGAGGQTAAERRRQQKKEKRKQRRAGKKPPVAGKGDRL